MTEKELKQAKELAKEVFKDALAQGGVLQVLSQKFDKETLEFFVKAIVGAFDTGFDCCIGFITSKED